MSGTLRRATAGDIDAILALVEANREHLVPRPRSEVEQLLDTFWVVEEGGEIAGCCCLEVYSPKIAEVRSLAVRAGSRGRGYGRQLVAAAIDEAKRRAIPQVLVITSNPEYFERLSFGPCLNEKYALFWRPDGPRNALSGDGNTGSVAAGPSTPPEPPR